MRKILVGLIFSFSSIISATEVDDVTTYYEPLADAEAVLNQHVQDLFEVALARQQGCSRRKLLRHMSSQLVGNIIFNTVEAFANTSDDVERHFTAVQASVYRHTSYQGGMIDTFVNLGPSVNVAGHRVGTDKLGHFFAMGYSLYEMARWGGSIKDLIAQSRREETGFWGLYTTGVKSYGDIASNLDGYRFWKELIDEGPNGYFVCDKNQLRQVRHFRWSDYISAAWSEVINCNAYWSEDFAAQVERNVQKLEAKFHRPYRCPIQPNQCATLRQHYAQWIPEENIADVISPLCR